MGTSNNAAQLTNGYGMRAARLHHLMREIEENLEDAHLSASRIAKKLGVSARYIHLLLEESGLSFSEHVLRQRLTRTAQILRDSAYADLSIAQIAYGAGFADLSHFNRSFRRLFGDTPTGVRLSRSRRNLRP